MKSLIVLVVLIASAFCEVEIPEEYRNAKSMAAFYGIKRDVGVEGRIVGGEESLIDHVPYFVLIYVLELTSGLVYQCGGSLIKHNWVLTAAHCFENRFTHLNTYLGVVERNRAAPDFLNGTSHYAEWESGVVVAQYPHPLYNPSTFTHDIALLMIPLTESGLSSLLHASVIKLPTWKDAGNDFVGFFGSVSGFGMTESGFLSDQLMTINFLPIISVDECRSYPGLEVYVTDLTICTSNKGRESVCQGDGGGSLAVTLSNARRIVGVVSFTIPGCISGFPGSYTRVTSYLPWISTIAGDDLIEEGSAAPSPLKLSIFLSALALVTSMIK